jgi:CheY-like chemotaxis protein
VNDGCDVVMIIEDDRDIRDSLVEVLEDQDYRPIGVANGKEAIDRLLGGARPCVILLDLMMPVMDGREFRARLLGEPQLGDIPIVVLTANADPSLATQGMAVAGCLTKPIQLTELFELIDRLCIKTEAVPG